jgi:hypothetical protein
MGATCAPLPPGGWGEGGGVLPEWVRREGEHYGRPFVPTGISFLAVDSFVIYILIPVPLSVF